MASNIAFLETINTMSAKTLNQMWNTYCDTYLTRLPLFHSPLPYVSAILCCAALIPICRLISKSLNSSKSKDVRAILLIHNGFCFGVYGVGLIILLTVSNFGHMLHTCQHTANITVFHQQVIKHVIYTYILMSIAAYIDPVIRAFGPQETVASLDVALDIVHRSIWSLLLALYALINPIGLTMTTVVFDCVHSVLHYGSAVLCVSHNDKTQFHKFNDLIRFFFFSIISAHAYNLTIVLLPKSTQCSPPVPGPYKMPLLFPVAVYAAITSAVSIVRLAVRFYTPPVASAIEKQVLTSGRTLRKNVKLTKLPVNTS